MKRMIMENADLAWFPEMGLICFLVGFLFVVIRIAMMSKDTASDVANLPLNEFNSEPEASHE